ncbi:hypothetical protein Tco_1203320 [Tanacetum coccineum]
MKRPKETTYQVVIDALALTTCYPTFLITADVLVIYMHQLWDTVYKHGSSYIFKIDNKKFAVNVEEFREILNICPRIHGQEFSDPIFEEEALSFVRHLGHTREIKYLTDITVDHLHQPWRAFATIINKCLSGKEDLAYQIDNKDAKNSDKMYYPRFTKAIISHYHKKNPSISMRNRMFMHTARDETILGNMKFVSKHEDVQVYGALMPKEMTNPEMLSSESFQTYYAIATGAEPPKSKKQRKDDSSKSSKATPTRKSTRMKRSAKVSPAGLKKKATAKADTRKGLKVLSEVALSEEAQLKEVLKRSKQDFYISHASGYDDGTDEGTGTKLGVPDVPKQNSESETESWGDSDEDDNDKEEASDNDDDDNAGNDDGDDDDDNDDDENFDDEEQQQEENADERVPTPEDMNFSDTEDDEEKNEEEEDDYEMLYRDVNVNLQQEDVDMTNADQGSAQDLDLQYEDARVTLTASQKTERQTQSSSVSSDFTSKLLNLENSYKAKFEKEAQAEQERFIEIIDKSMKEMVKDEVKSQLTKILPKKIADFATPLIEITIADSHERVVLAKSSSQPKSTYEAAASLTEFDLKKILLNKMQDSESYRAALEHRELYDSLAKSYNIDKDLFDTYGEPYSLKRDRDEKDKDEDPSVRPDRWEKKRKTDKDEESSKE